MNVIKCLSRRTVAIALGIAALSVSARGAERWVSDRAWQWYREQPLPIGFNYIPANSVSYTEMWMGYAFDPGLIDRELSLAQGIGFRCTRVVLPFVVWEADPEAFKKRFDTFLSVAQGRGIKVIPCFFDDCAFGPISDPVFGRQPAMVAGWYANAWTPSPGHARVRDPRMRPALERYVKDVMGAHRADSRILMWDLYNEPSNSGMGDDSLPLMRDEFAWARTIVAVQPLTSGEWGGTQAVTEFQRANSDVITFHNYSPAPVLLQEIRGLRALGRPIVCTEWMNRNTGSTVQTCLRLFVDERVGALSWGLVNGKTQTDLPWGHRPGDPSPKVWQHDLYSENFLPYDPTEIEAFRAAIWRTSVPVN
jgi:hypothetical protein